MPAMTAEQTAAYITPTTSSSPAAPTPSSATDAATLVHDAARGLPRAVNNIATLWGARSQPGL